MIVDDRKRCVLISLTIDGLKDMLGSLDYSKIELIAMVSDSNDDIDVRIDNRRVPFFDFSRLDEVINTIDSDDIYYLIGGYRRHIREFGLLNRIIRLFGRVNRERIVNLSLLYEENWLIKYRYAMQGELEYFSTGISYMMSGLSLNDLPLGKGVNLAASSQDIFYGLEIAKRVLKKNRNVKYALIGLSPYAFSYCMEESFSARGMSTAYDIAWNSGGRSSINRMFLKPSTFDWHDLDNKAYNPESDLWEKKLGLREILDVESELRDILPSGDIHLILNNQKCLKEYIDLCRENDCIPVGVVFPMAPLLQKKYPIDSLKEYRSILNNFSILYNFFTIDLWDMELPMNCFYDLPHLNKCGAKLVTQRLYSELKKLKLTA